MKAVLCTLNMHGQSKKAVLCILSAWSIPEKVLCILSMHGQTMKAVLCISGVRG